MNTTAPQLPEMLHDQRGGWFLQALSGNADAATQLYDHCVPPLRAWLAGRMHWSMAEDIAHEAMIAAFRKGTRFQPGQSFQAWLKVIAWRIALNQHRGEMRRRSREVAFVEQERRLGRGNSGDETPRFRALRICVRALPEEDQRLLSLKYDQGFTAEAIASAHDRNRSAVAVHLHRICRRLGSDIERMLKTRPQTASAALLASSGLS